MGNTNGREVLIADGPDVGLGGVVDDSIVINQGTSARPQPQLLFHSVHGVNVRTSKGGRLAKRVESFCKGLAFSNRPIAIDENVCLRFAEIATNWSGVLRFGVTNTDPATLREDLPKFACPDLTSKEGNWAKALAERYCQQGSILHFYVRENGELYYGINGVLKGLFLSGINTSLPLWVMVDIYGNTNSLEFVDPSEVRIKPSRHSRPPPTLNTPAVAGPSLRHTTPIREVHEEIQPTPPMITPNMAALSLSSLVRPPVGASSTCPIRYHAGVDFERVALHTIRGKNVVMSGDYTSAERTETEYAGGYVFSSRPLNLNEKVVVQVLSVLPAYQGGLAFGLTCCDPIHLRPEALPDDSDDLLERGEYWVGIKDVAAMPKTTDELAFWINDEGEVHFYRNNGTPRVIMYVDQSQRLWFWFDIYGSTQKVRILGSTAVSSRSATLRPSSSGAASTSSTMRRQVASMPSMADQRCSSASSNDRPSSSTTTPMLRVSLPPPLVPARISPPRPEPTSATNRRQSQPSSPPVRPPPPPPKPSPYGRPPVTPAARPSPDPNEGDECTVCMNAGVDSVIYQCGHMCMCYNCACEQWQRKGDCPICRKTITDVIRIYKS